MATVVSLVLLVFVSVAAVGLPAPVIPHPWLATWRAVSICLALGTVLGLAVSLWLERIEVYQRPGIGLGLLLGFVAGYMAWAFVAKGLPTVAGLLVGEVATRTVTVDVVATGRGRGACPLEAEGATLDVPFTRFCVSEALSSTARKRVQLELRGRSTGLGFLVTDHRLAHEPAHVP